MYSAVTTQENNYSRLDEVKVSADCNTNESELTTEEASNSVVSSQPHKKHVSIIIPEEHEDDSQRHHHPESDGSDFDTSSIEFQRPEDNDSEEEEEETENDSFIAIVEQVRQAIVAGIHPIPNSQGSSGSYFCRNLDGQIVAIFKPKNEEPYGKLNPKWTKWIHRNLFPCCFGRGCLIPNLGYLSEAAASLMSRRLHLGIVPRTEVIALSSPIFHYSSHDHRKARKNNTPLPEKVGSFQLFLNGYQDATHFLRNHPLPSDLMSLLPKEDDGKKSLKPKDAVNGFDKENAPCPSPETAKLKKDSFDWTLVFEQFREDFEKMVILDYVIRNTDRGADNWMIRFCPVVETSALAKEHIHIAAIDNGLAFPFKHPDRWRSYPYGWLNMPLANIPFSKKTRERLLPILTSSLWWHQTAQDLYQLFCIDADFDEDMFARQLAVMKGQIHNLVDILTNPVEGLLGPTSLFSTPNLLVWEEVVNEEEEVLDNDGLAEFEQSESHQNLVTATSPYKVTDNDSIHHPLLQFPASTPTTSASTSTLPSPSDSPTDRSTKLNKSSLFAIPLSSSHLPVAGTSSSMVDPPKQFHMPRPPKKIRRKLRKARRNSSQTQKQRLAKGQKKAKKVKKKVIERLESLHIRPWFTWC